jgi:hypothetical protein
MTLFSVGESANPDMNDKGNESMARRQAKIASTSDADEPAPLAIGQTRKPESGQFRLQVDRKTKASYLTYEDAEQAGLAIKQAHPILQVVLYGTIGVVNKILEVPRS